MTRRLHQTPAHFFRVFFAVSFAVFCFAATPASAATYVNTTWPFNWIDPLADGHTDITASNLWNHGNPVNGCVAYDGAAIDDDIAGPFNLGFSFTFGSATYNQVYVQSNGRLQFTSRWCGWGNEGLFRSTLDNTLGPTSAGTQTDVDVTPGPSTCKVGTCGLFYKSIGAAPNRQFVVTWNKVPMWNTNNSEISFQVILNEDGTFIYQYAGKSKKAPAFKPAWQLGYNTDQDSLPTPSDTLDSAFIFYKPPVPLADYRMDEASWNGTSGEVKDVSGNGYDATASGATTASGTPAYASGTQSTCNYGLFDRPGTTLTYAQLPASFPKLSSNFTVTAWIRSSDVNAANHQRIFANDDFDQGFAISLSDGTKGAIRLFNRKVSFKAPGGGVILDTPAVVTSNAWYFVAASVDISNKYATLYVYDAAGVQKTKVGAAFTGTWGTDAGATAIGGETLASSEGKQTTWHFLGNIDEVQVFNSALSQIQVQTLLSRVRTCLASALHHLEIQHGSGTGLTCTPSTLTVRACQNAACTSPYTGGVSGSLAASGTPTVNWVGGATFSIPAGSGSVTKDVQVTTPGSVAFGIAATPAPAPASGATCNFGTPACTFNVTDAGFLLSTIPDHAAETLQTFTLSAVKKSDNSLACVPAFQNRTNVPVTFSCSYLNPGSGTLPVRVTGNMAAATATPLAASTSSACSAGGAGVNLNFDANGIANNLSLIYADAGKMQISARYAPTTGPEAGLTLLGSGTFIAAPASFSIGGIQQTAAPNTLNPGATGPAGNVFVKAGEAFSATVTAQNAVGAATPNFGKESPAEGVIIKSTLVAPTGAGTSNGTFSGNVGPFNNGIASGAAFGWSEAGIIKLTADLSSANYLGSGLTASGVSGNVGRFIPAYFETQLTPGCSTGAPQFTYSGQPFAVQVSAKNMAGVITQNYQGAAPAGFAKNTTLSNAGVVANFTGNQLTGAAYTAGVGAKTDVLYTFPSKKTAPVTLTLRAVDSDMVSSAGHAEGTNGVRSGRLRFNNAYGSELLDLGIPIETQYWNGTAFVRNTADNCTSLANISATNNNFVLKNYTQNLGAGETALLPAATISFAAGTASLRLSKPGAGNNGSVNMCADLDAAAGIGDTSCQAPVPGDMVYLQDENGKDPVARATFGLYKSDLIYMRETY